MKYYLMVKEAVGLGVKYLCKCGDYKDPHAYKGSGVFWRRIIDKHQCEIKTTILGVYDSKEALREAGEHYSKLYNVVEDRSWANLIPEIGDGGSTTKGFVRAYHPETKEQKCFKSASDIPEGWTKGSLPWKKSRDSVEKSRNAHLGKKRSEETRAKMRKSTRKPRATVNCSKCGRSVTLQNVARHELNCIGI